MQPKQLTAHHEERADAFVIRFTGEVDLAVDSEFSSHLAAGLDAASAMSSRLLVVDLTAVTFFGSNGLSQVVRCRDKGVSSGTALKLASTSPIVNRVMRATRLDEILPLFATVDDALGSIPGAMPGSAN